MQAMPKLKEGEPIRESLTIRFPPDIKAVILARGSGRWLERLVRAQLAIEGMVLGKETKS